jgi:hypothetical protein
MFDLAGNSVGYFVGRGESQVVPVAAIFGSGRDGLTPTAADYTAARNVAADFRRAAIEGRNRIDLRRCRMYGPSLHVPEFLVSSVLLPADRKGRAVVSDEFDGVMLMWTHFSRERHPRIIRATAIRGGGMIPWLRRPTHEKAADQVNRSLPSRQASGANGGNQAAA